MAGFQESDAKQAIRELLADACGKLGRSRLTYLGMPSDEARDILTLGRVLENVICVDDERIPGTLDELRRNIARLPLKVRRLTKANMWSYLREHYPAERLLADVSFLDFCGGGIRNQDPFANELAGIRSFFTKHARVPERAFVFAWTYMPRDDGRQAYVDVCKELGVDKHLVAQVEASHGVKCRSMAVRIVLYKSLREHNLSAQLFQHAQYKGTMNTVILVFSKQRDPACLLPLSEPSDVLYEHVVVYDSNRAVPRLEPLLQPP